MSEKSFYGYPVYWNSFNFVPKTIDIPNTFEEAFENVKYFSTEEEAIEFAKTLGENMQLEEIND